MSSHKAAELLTDISATFAPGNDADQPNVDMDKPVPTDDEQPMDL